MTGGIYNPVSGLKIALMREVFAATGNTTDAAANELTTVFMSAKEVAVASGLFTMQKAAAGELMGDATILATESGASNVTSEGMKNARAHVIEASIIVTGIG